MSDDKVKVAIANCPDYDTKIVYDAVKRSVEHLGGIKAFVKPGNKVLVKPNLLSARTPDEAVDTHPEVVRAVVRLVKEADAIPLIGDSPGGYGADIDNIYDKSGMRSVAGEEGAELVKFKTTKLVNGIPFTKYLFDCDCTISIPKLKTHCLTIMTAAIKNMYGSVAGLYKTERHSVAPKEKDFVKILAKVYSIAKPKLSIIDAVMAMEGDGPSGGKPRHMGFIMAGTDCVAMDACAATIMGLKPLDVLTIKEASGSGLGEADLSRIEICGEPIAQYIKSDFKLPQTIALKAVPTAIANKMAGFIKFRPWIDSNICARCNLCKTTCPVGAIEIGRNACVIDYDKCVRCMCCHEVCPYKAISIKRNILARIVWG